MFSNILINYLIALNHCSKYCSSDCVQSLHCFSQKLPYYQNHKYLPIVPLEDFESNLRFLTTHRVMNVIPAYAPTRDKPDEMVEKLSTLIQNKL